MTSFSSSIPSLPSLLGGHGAPAMNRDRILELLELLPLEWLIGPALNGMSAASLRHAAHKRRAALLYDPAFAWKFAALHARHGKPLPWLVIEEPIRAAHHHLTTGEACPTFTRVLALAGHPQIGAALRALLVAKDSDIHQIAAWLGEDDIIVNWFATLLWSVAFRRDEPGFISAVVYPNSRLSMLDTAATPAWEQSLLQFGWQGGMAAVFDALGTPAGSGDVAGTLDDLESALLREANEQARLGGYSRSRTSAALREATRLVQTKKLHEVKLPFSNIPAGGLEAIGDRYSVADEIMAHAAVAAAPVLEDPRDAAVRAKIFAARRAPDADGKSNNSGKNQKT